MANPTTAETLQTMYNRQGYSIVEIMNVTGWDYERTQRELKTAGIRVVTGPAARRR